MTTKYNKGWENLRSLADVSPEERHSTAERHPPQRRKSAGDWRT